MVSDMLFIQMLRWKDSQNLLVFMLDDAKSYNGTARGNYLIAPFWHKLNSILECLDDNINGRKYNVISSELKFWKECKPKFNTCYGSILSELYLHTMSFKTMQEIIYQSNPDSLHPIQFYAKQKENEFIAVSNEYLLNLEHRQHHECVAPCTTDPDCGEWVLSMDYDPFDL